jgi:hypothetical protein
VNQGICLRLGLDYDKLLHATCSPSFRGEKRNEVKRMPVSLVTLGYAIWFGGNIHKGQTCYPFYRGRSSPVVKGHLDVNQEV